MPEAYVQPWRGQLAETAPLIRAALARLNGGVVVITTLDDVPVTSGKLLVVEGRDGPLVPSLLLEFSLRGMTFAIEVPLGSVFRLVATWTGSSYVFRLPADGRLQVEWPMGVADA